MPAGNRGGVKPSQMGDGRSSEDKTRAAGQIWDFRCRDSRECVNIHQQPRQGLEYDHAAFLAWKANSFASLWCGEITYDFLIARERSDPPMY